MVASVGRSERTPARLSSLALALLLFVLVVAALAAGSLLQAVALPVLKWNFVGMLLALAVTLAFLALVPRVDRENAGLVWRWSFGRHLVPALVVTALLVALNVWQNSAGGAEASFAEGPAWQAWLYQATLPGPVEEIAFRGVLLALLDQALPPRWRVGGVLMGWGAVIQAVLFGLGHFTGGVAAGLFSVLFGLVVAWLRYASGSVWPAVFAHNATNTAAVPFMTA